MLLCCLLKNFPSVSPLPEVWEHRTFLPPCDWLLLFGVFLTIFVNIFKATVHILMLKMHPTGFFNQQVSFLWRMQLLWHEQDISPSLSLQTSQNHSVHLFSRSQRRGGKWGEQVCDTVTKATGWKVCQRWNDSSDASVDRKTTTILKPGYLFTIIHKWATTALSRHLWLCWAKRNIF